MRTPRPPSRRTFEPSGRRQLKRAVRGGVQWREVPAGQPNRPSLYFYAVALLVLSGLLALIGGIAAIGPAPAVGGGLVGFAVLSGIATWQLLRHTRVGYWLAVVTLIVAGVTPVVAFLATDGGVAGVIFCPPAVVGFAMLWPKARQTIVHDRPESSR